MASDQMVSVSLIWQLGHVRKGADVFAEPRIDGFAFTCFVVFLSATLQPGCTPVATNTLDSTLLLDCHFIDSSATLQPGCTPVATNTLDSTLLLDCHFIDSSATLQPG